MTVQATDAQIRDVRTGLEDDPQVKDFRFLDKPAAYEEFKRIFRKDPDLVKNVDADALPTSFRIVPARAEFTNAIKKRFEPRAGVDDVATPAEALRGLLSATSTARIIFIGLSIVLLVSSLFLIVNTIRLATFARRREIEVMKLVGASNWFVRVPFMAEGLVQGAIGAGFAFGLVYALKWLITKLLKNQHNLLQPFYASSHDVFVIGSWVLVI